VVLKARTKLLEDVEKQEVCGNEKQWSKFIPGDFHPFPECAHPDFLLCINPKD